MPSYKYRTERTPSLWNSDMALGFLIAGSLTTLAPFTLPGMIVAGAMVAAGTLIGGWLGKNRMQEEARDGKIANEPGYWNKTTLIGTLLFPVIGTAIGAHLGKQRQAREYATARATGVEVDPVTHIPLARTAEPLPRSAARPLSAGIAEAEAGFEPRTNFLQTEMTRRSRPESQERAPG